MLRSIRPVILAAMAAVSVGATASGQCDKIKGKMTEVASIRRQ